jgi:hypothetical protein
MGVRRRRHTVGGADDLYVSVAMTEPNLGVIQRILALESELARLRQELVAMDRELSRANKIIETTITALREAARRSKNE